MKKPMNHKRRLRALETSEPAKRRDPGAMALILHYRGKGGFSKNLRKEASRKACRGKVQY